MGIMLNREHLKGFIEEADIEGIIPQIEKAHSDLENKTGQGSEFTGWTGLPTRIEDSFLNELEKMGEDVRKDTDCLVSIGIGGS